MFVPRQLLCVRQVEPFAGIVDAVRLTIPRVLFNMQAVGPFKRKRRMNDVVVKGQSIRRRRRRRRFVFTALVHACTQLHRCSVRGCSCLLFRGNSCLCCTEATAVFCTEATAVFCIEATAVF